MGGTLTVPYPFDVVIDSQGYVFHDAENDKALFGNTSTFVPRQNTQGNYGDDQQDTWLTVTQKDWSLGEEQKHYRVNDEDSARRFWRGKNVNVIVPGEVSIRAATRSITPAAAPTCAVGDIFNDRIYFATSTNLYYVIYDGTITTSIGAHGLGAAPDRFGIAADGRHFYLTSTSGGSVGVRRWNGAAFSTWSATGANSLAYLNNALYGYRTDNSDLLRYDTAGTATSIFQWRDASGDATGYGATGRIVPYGGKLLIFRTSGGSGRGSELWLYDGTAPAKIAEFPPNFIAFDMEVLNGTVFLSGHIRSYKNTTQRNALPTIYFYKDGQQGILWQAERTFNDGGSDASPALTAFDGGLVFWDQAGLPPTGSPRLCFYNPDTGGISTIVEESAFLGNDILVATNTFFMLNLLGSTTTLLYPHNTDNASAAEVDSSLIDFDSSLPKLIRGIRAEFEATGTGTVDLLYRFDDLESSYASLQTSVTSGTEYPIAAPAEGTTYKKVSIRAKLNRGATTTSQVKLKRVAVRGMAIYPAYKKRTYILYLGGVDGKSPVQLRDETSHALDGKDMATNLQTAAGRTSPFTITDHLGTFTGRIDEGGLEMMEIRPQVWVARVRVREV